MMTFPTFWAELSVICERIILGDVNLDTFNYLSSTHVQSLVDNFITYGFSPLISKATNFFRSASTGIDHIWCNTVSGNVYSGVIDESTSTHKPIFANIPTKVDELDESVSSSNFIAHNISAKNIDKFDTSINPLFEEYSNFHPQLRCQKSIYIFLHTFSRKIRSML